MNITYIIIGFMVTSTTGALITSIILFYGWIKGDKEYLVDKELELFNRHFNVRELVTKTRAMCISVATLIIFIFMLM